MPSASRVVLALGLSSLWQAISGYVDVYSHRFIFTVVDPALNPAHVSLYTASTVGLVVVLFGPRGAETQPVWAAVMPGLLVARFGAIGEVIAGLLNEVYHQLFAGVSTNEIIHLSIHGLFVASMLIVAAGAVISAMTLGAISQCMSADMAGATARLVSFAAVWLIAAGSVSYLAGEFLRVDQGFLYLTFGGFAVSAVAVSGLLASRTIGLLTLAGVGLLGSFAPECLNTILERLHGWCQ